MADARPVSFVPPRLPLTANCTVTTRDECRRGGPVKEARGTFLGGGGDFDGPLPGSVMYRPHRSAPASDGIAVDRDAAGGGKEGDDIGDFCHVDKASDRDIGG